MLSLQMKRELPEFTVDVNLQVGNEILILFGPSGSGKTTILNCIAGLDKLNSGTIDLNGSCLFQTGKKPVAVQQRQIGYVFQDFALFPHMTVEKKYFIWINKSDSCLRNSKSNRN